MKYIIAYYHHGMNDTRFFVTDRDVSAFDGVFLNDTFDIGAERRLRKLLWDIDFSWTKTLGEFPKHLLRTGKAKVIVTGEL